MPTMQIKNEYSNHITECQALEAITTLHDEVLKFEGELDQIKTSHAISVILTTTLYDDINATFSSHIQSYNGLIPVTAYELIQEAAAEQDSIEKTGLLHRHIVHKWRTAQDIIYQSTPGCRQNGTTWAHQVIKGLYRITRAMWEHRNKSLFPTILQVSTKQTKENMEQRQP